MEHSTYPNLVAHSMALILRELACINVRTLQRERALSIPVVNFAEQSRNRLSQCIKMGSRSKSIEMEDRLHRACKPLNESYT